MGSVEPYATDAGRRYRVRYRDPDRRSREKGGFTTKRAAEEYLANVTVSAARGEWIDPNAARAEIDALAAGWFAAQGHLKPSSRRSIEIALRKHVLPVWGRRRVAEIRHSEVQAWVSSFTSSPTTVIRAHGVLAGILEVAVRDRRISVNPARDVKLPRKVRKEHTYLTHQQVHDLAAASGGRDALILLLAYTGLRWGEAIGLRVKDLDLLKGRVHVTVNAVEVGGSIEVGTPKSHKRRTVPIPPLLVEALAAQCVGRGRDDLVFSLESGEHLRRVRTSAGSKSWLVNALAEIGVESMTVHDLRHTAASLAVSSGANVKAVQRMLGHASAAMTLDVYADLFDDDLQAVADRLEEAARREVVGVSWGIGSKPTTRPAKVRGITG